MIGLLVDDVRREDDVGRDLVVQLLEQRDNPVELHLLVDDLLRVVQDDRAADKNEEAALRVRKDRVSQSQTVVGAESA